jgi:hypothetical protein
MRPYKVFLVVSCQLWLRHHCRLNSPSGRTTCGIVAILNRRLLGRFAASLPSWLIFIVASLPLAHSCGIMLLWKQYETIQGLSCGIMPPLITASYRLYLRHHYRLDSASHRTTCGITADLNRRLVGRLAASSPSWLIFIVAMIATSTLLWYYTAQEAVWVQSCLGCGIIADLIFIIVASLPLPHFCGIMLLLVAVWDQTWSRLRHFANLKRRLVGQLAAWLPTWFVLL